LTLPVDGGRAEYAAALGLAWVGESGCHCVLRLLRKEGPESIWRAPCRRLVEWGLTPRAAAGFEEKRRGFVATEAEAVMKREGVRFLPFGSRRYPAELGHLCLPPAGLFVRAGEDALERMVGAPRVTIVGTRKVTAHGSRVAEAFSSAFAARGVVVVSGMALGVDGRAHEAAARAGGLTVAVLGCGIDIVYPRRHRWLYEKIVADGVVASELPPGTPPSRWTFPHRNRLLAALGDAVLVVEASRRSGALQTADWALELGRPVFSVPGPPFIESHEGCNALLYDGAYPALDPCVTVEDFLSTTRIERGEHRSTGRPRCMAKLEGSGARGVPVLSAARVQVLDALESGSCSVDGLMGLTGLTTRQLTAALAELELVGLAVRAGPGLHIRAP
jgi:DNA processing protein